MSVVNPLAREISAKVVYYGPGLSGKTTSLVAIHRQVRADRRGNLVSLATEGDRTLYFDLLPIELKKIGELTLRLQLYTVPGQVFYGATRRLVLEGADAVIFVADSQREAQERNLESRDDLRRNLSELDTPLEEMPFAIQYNKRDLPHCESLDELRRTLNPSGVPDFETIASTGQGVLEALKAVSLSLSEKLAARVQPNENASARVVAPDPIIAQPGDEDDTLGRALVRMGESLRAPDFTPARSEETHGIPSAPPLDSFGSSERPVDSSRREADSEVLSPSELSILRHRGDSWDPGSLEPNELAGQGRPFAGAETPLSSAGPAAPKDDQTDATAHNQQTVQAPAPEQLTFVSLFRDGRLVTEIESDIRAGYFAEAVYRATGGVSRILDDVLGTTSVETSATRAQLLGLDGREYLQLRRLGSRPATTIGARDALFALYMLVSAHLKAERLDR